MNRTGLFLIMLITTLLTSCFKEDDKVPPRQPGDVMTDTIGMDQTYKNQVYFDLGTGTSVQSNLKTSSDLGFDCSPDGWRIILNTSDFATVADLGVLPFGQAQDTAHAIWKFDKSDGNPDSLGIGRWFTVNNGDTLSNHHVYVVNRGMDENGDNLGLMQVIFDSLSQGTYYFRFTNMSGGAVNKFSVKKDPSVNFLFFTFKFGGALKPLEPPKTDYDLLFTQYTTLLYTDIGEAYPYLVTGVLINPNKVKVCPDSLHSFETVTLDNVIDLHYSSNLDAIGYDWKSYDFNAGSYTVNSKLLYIIRDTEGYYFKLRFISFYNESGQKGYPVIEFQRL
ncbi:MAG: hypothetical protein NTU44_08205 [Bacteroidetes bacterium]|nr:hypothetical protein [Bacteroidota bacterium]